MRQLHAFRVTCAPGGVLEERRLGRVGTPYMVQRVLLVQRRARREIVGDNHANAGTGAPQAITQEVQRTGETDDGGRVGVGEDPDDRVEMRAQLLNLHRRRRGNRNRYSARREHAEERLKKCPACGQHQHHAIPWAHVHCPEVKRAPTCRNPQLAPRDGLGCRTVMRQSEGHEVRSDPGRRFDQIEECCGSRCVPQSTRERRITVEGDRWCLRNQDELLCGEDGLIASAVQHCPAMVGSTLTTSKPTDWSIPRSSSAVANR